MCVFIYLFFTTNTSKSVIKSRLQAGTANSLRYKSSLDGLLTILKEEGIEGLYRGIGSKVTQSVLTAAILFAGQRRIFELTKAVSTTSQAHSIDTMSEYAPPGSPACCQGVESDFARYMKYP